MALDWGAGGWPRSDSKLPFVTYTYTYTYTGVLGVIAGMLSPGPAAAIALANVVRTATIQSGLASPSFAAARRAWVRSLVAAAGGTGIPGFMPKPAMGTSSASGSFLVPFGQYAAMASW